MNTKKVIGSLVYLLGALLLGASSDDWQTALLVYLGVSGMIAGWRLMDE